MKKLMIAAAIVCAAVAVNASTVTWGAATAATIPSTSISAGTMYFMYSSTGKIDWTKFDGQESFSTATITAAGFDKTIDSFSYVSGTTFGKKNNALTPTSTGLTAGTYNFYSILISSDGKTAAYDTTAKSTQIAATVGMNQTKTSSSFTIVQAGEPEPTPEPTSALLMLLGVAGLALRRKQK